MIPRTQKRLVKDRVAQIGHEIALRMDKEGSEGEGMGGGSGEEGRKGSRGEEGEMGRRQRRGERKGNMAGKRWEERRIVVGRIEKS